MRGILFCFVSMFQHRYAKEQQGQRDGALASSNDDSKMSSVLTLLEVSACTCSEEELANASVLVKFALIVDITLQ